ncbi:hypothetical protein WS69_22430 [Burkholderia sp. BDU5]|nr:hypothetical protein WS69_22430 [Burkholderia sp. BDU5]
MIGHTRALPVSQQARLVGIARSSVYCRPRPVSEADQLLMRRIDEPHMESVCRRADAGASLAPRAP